ncbi:type VI secretion system secreted protein VgrG [Pseudomonas flexibilis]|uniref:Type VI secretion system secreted protein VgrG n=2 Tax=Pseudomonas flexibilis TaxID=706570 RepID=A0A1N7AEC1_9PSED|nr:type VI secretion system tip protein TssI/VgrG [Pseudomonas flexibilis]SIR37341.1 type VI secretion system secreted protein VgrG [Pseudomonas flexibilis]
MSTAQPVVFTLTIPGAPGDFKVLAFSGHEAIGAPFRFDLELVSDDADINLDALLLQPAFLSFGKDQGGVHGLIESLAQGETGNRLTRYSLSLVPHLARLALRTHSRIFQQRSVPQILAQLLEEHGIPADTADFQALPEDYPPREHCVQYAETDLQFFQRLCEEDGLHYHFRHSDTGHVLVFGNDAQVFGSLAQPLPYLPSAAAAAVTRFGLRLASRPSALALRSYDFQQSHLKLEASFTQPPADQDAEQSHAVLSPESYAFEPRFRDGQAGKQLAQHTLEARRVDQRRAEGLANHIGLRAGHLFDLSQHPREDCNRLWLLTEVRHQGRQPQVLEEHAEAFAANLPAEAGWEDAGPFSQGYRNRFSAIPGDQALRLPALHPRPRLLGSQSAKVIGPKENEGSPPEEIHCDEYGRVQVQFHWEREAPEQTSRAWLRVASGWAGSQYGALLIPRVGMEVLVSFLNGDPEQPLITGCLYNLEQQPPYPLPEHKTRSVFKTRSTPNGQGGNELRIDDRKDAEQIYLHAQRDWEQHVNHDQRLHIGHQRHSTVEGNSHSELKAEEHRITHGNRLVELKADDHLTVAGSQHLKLGTGQFIEAGEEIHLKAGQKLVIEAGSELTVQAGGSFIKLDAGGVSVVGAEVKLNSGGSAGSGAGAAPLLPGQLAPTEAEASIPPEALIKQDMLFRSTEAGVCEVCEAAHTQQEDKA